MTLGEKEYLYDANNYLITSVHLPATFQVVNATQDEPYLGLLLKIDIHELSQLMIDSNLSVPRSRQPQRCIATGEVTLPLLMDISKTGKSTG